MKNLNTFNEFVNEGRGKDLSKEQLDGVNSY
jgi:hypothetical protein